ncbi:MAG: efflux RND transporter periplasmic adaptor subunit [Deltaproteobacteria bacterium HGW-Deltaproteobacteria-13]|jgi:RND family efflux transporter MFP subunit|nr:MAG: efflux RND transporter periplasmic adaptor subunit [Deltaproteobacteria bacterium HGW-Deltaproteobacteria-13]
MKSKYAFLFFLSIIIVITGCNAGKPAAENAANPVPVLTQRINKVAFNKEIAVSGSIEGRKTVKLGFMVAGKVNYIAVEEGAMIGAGQLLASLDPENYRIAKEMADANLTQVQDEYDRLSIMHGRKSISEGDYAKISNALKLAKAQQRLQIKNLSDTKLYAPIKGVLLKKGAEAGEIIAAGMPLFVISDIDTVKVNASIPETDLNEIKIGGEARIFISSVDSTLTGKVVEIGSVSEPATRAFNVKIELRNPGLKVRPGMTAEVKITSAKKMEVIAVPGEAVLRDLDNSAYVFVADEKKKQAFKRKVSLGQMAGNNIEIASGLNVNEIIVAGGQHKLNDGSAIILK